MEYVWKTVEMSGEERVPPITLALCGALGREFKAQFHIFLFRASELTGADPIAWAQIVLDRDGKFVDETAELYFDPTGIDLARFYRALTSASSMPPGLLEWWIDSSTSLVKMGDSALYNLEWYTFGETEEDKKENVTIQQNMKKDQAGMMEQFEWVRGFMEDMGPFVFNRPEVNLVLSEIAAEEGKGGAG